jgi:hypothetical protein
MKRTHKQMRTSPCLLEVDLISRVIPRNSCMKLEQMTAGSGDEAPRWGVLRSI